jgi:hypothetical protein
MLPFNMTVISGCVIIFQRRWPPKLYDKVLSLTGITSDPYVNIETLKVSKETFWVQKN